MRSLGLINCLLGSVALVPVPDCFGAENVPAMNRSEL